MSYRITNQQLGTTIVVDTLPPGVRVGVTDIGPVWNNQPAPKLIVEETEMQREDVRALKAQRRFSRMTSDQLRQQLARGGLTREQHEIIGEELGKAEG